MDDNAIMTLMGIAAELTARRTEARREGTRFDRDSFENWAQSKHGLRGSQTALILVALDAGDQITQNNIYGGTFMLDNSGETNIRDSQVVGSAVGHGNKLKIGNIAIDSQNKGANLSLPEAHAKLLEAIDELEELHVSEKTEAKGHADALKAELEKPESNRNKGYIVRCFNKLCAVAPEVTGRFMGSFTAAYFEQK